MTPEEIRALADVFADPVAAGQLVEAAGLARSRHPAWPAGGSGSFWSEVSRLLAAGALVDGRENLLAVAAALYPANAAFGTVAPVAEPGFDRDATVLPLWYVPWLRNPNFTGRDDELNALRERFSAKGAVSMLPQALYGLGGVGKTQLAVEYCYRFRDFYEIVWWISAGPGGLVSGLAELARRLGVAIHGAAAESAAHAVDLLAGHRRVHRWLVVVDDAGSPPDPAAEDPDRQVLTALLRATGSGGQVLVTSRDPAWAGLAEAVRVEVLRRVEAVRFLRRRAPRLLEVQGEHLADLLGDLPLALEQAGAWLDQSGMAVEIYLDLLDRRTQAILAEGKPDGYPVPVAATWTLAVDRLKNPAAIWLLRLWAHCGHDPIPADLIGPGVAHLLPAPLDEFAADPLSFGRLVQTLTALGLLRVLPHGFVLHRLVQAVLRAHTPPHDRDTARRALHQLLAAADPADPDLPANWPRYAQLRPHAVASGLADSDDYGCRQLALRLPWFLNAAGDYQASLVLGTDTYNRWSRRLGSHDSQTLAIGIGLVGTLIALRDDVSAHTLAEEVRARVPGALGDDHPTTLMADSGLSAALLSTGDYAEGQALAEAILARRRATLGDDHPLTLGAAIGVAAALLGKGEFSAARTLSEQVHTRLRGILGEDHPTTLTAASGLVTTLTLLGDLPAARALAEEVLARRRAVLGNDHPHALDAAANLAGTLLALGDLSDAHRLFEDVLARCREAFGDDHPRTLSAAANLAAALGCLGDASAARSMLDEVVIRSRDTLGDDHPDTLTAMAKLGYALISLGEIFTAQTLLEEVWARGRDALSDNHLSTLGAATGLSTILAEQGDHLAARALAADVLARCRTTYGDDHLQTLTIAVILADVLVEIGDQDAARTLFEEVLTRSRNLLGDEHPFTVSVRRSLLL
nr:FxSxx-COOH system tetratricopeptide repeat protein [Pseudofrankia inefficax]